MAPVSSSSPRVIRSRGVALSLLSALVALGCPALAAAAEIVIPLEGEVPEGGPDHFYVDFEVPEGIVEIEVRHDDLSTQNILDWGLDDPEGFRGWGGGNAEPAVVGIDAASRSYLAGPIRAGTWRVVVGKAKIEETPARYEIEVILRDEPTLPPEPERAPYAAPAPLSDEARWYAGDFHAHSDESGDARASMDAVATLARQRGLDFVHLAEHNTTSQLQRYSDVQARHPELLLLPGAEYTTYDGHGLAIGATQWVEHKVGLDGATVEAALAQMHAEGALFAVAHPVFELGNLCIGCAWKQDTGAERIDAVEIATGGLDKAGGIFGTEAIAYWDALLDTGVHAAAIGGSDDHRAGVDLGAFDSPVGDPTTMVFAEELSTERILAGIAAGRTVVKLQGPDDPMVELRSRVAPDGDTVRALETGLEVEVWGGQGSALRLVTDGVRGASVPVDADPFVHTFEVAAPETGERRYRAELLVDGGLRVVTSHLWVTAEGADPVGGGDDTGGSEDTGGGEGGAKDDGASGCACDLAPQRGGAAGWGLALLGIALFVRRRARR